MRNAALSLTYRRDGDAFVLEVFGEIHFHRGLPKCGVQGCAREMYLNLQASPLALWIILFKLLKTQGVRVSS